jgi:hypothetical protein
MNFKTTVSPLGRAMLKTLAENDADCNILTLKPIANAGLDMCPPRPFHYQNDSEKRYDAEQRVASALQELVESLEQLENSY